MVERAFFAVAGLSVLLTACAQTPSHITEDEGSDGVDVTDDSKSAPESDKQAPGSGPSISGNGRSPSQSDASTRGTSAARSDAGTRDDDTRDDASTTAVPVGGADAGGPEGGGAGGGAGAGGGNGAPTIVGVTRTPAGAGSCSTPGEAQLEDVSNPTTVIGNGSPSSCTGSAFVDAVARGGVITFNCGPNPVTIQLQQTAKVVNSTRKIVIDGGGKVALSGGGARRILYQNTCDPAQGHATAHCDNQDFPQLTVQNLTFTDGAAPGNEARDGGGAILAQGGRFKIVNSHFYRNKCAGSGADVGGGAVRALMQHNNQPVYIVNSTFGGSAGQGNEGSNGGALSAIGVNYVLIGSTLTHNRAVGRGANPAKAGTPGGGSGGAIYLDGTDFHLRVCGSEIANNQANEHGGGIFFVSNDRSGTMRIENSTVNDNRGGAHETHPGLYVEANGEPSFPGTQVR